jgi:histidinol-phosphate phosphatase family protein
MQLVIIAGGKGTRLLGLTGGLPKPMVDMGGKPLLEHQIDLARRYGIEDILVLTGFGAESIENYFGRSVQYHREKQALGTGGALLEAFEALPDTFVVMYGDTMLNVALDRFIAFHQSDSAATLFLHPNDHPQDSDLVELNEANEVVAIHAYPHPPDRYLPNLVNAALYVFSKSALARLREDWLRNPVSLDVCRNLFPQMLTQGLKLRGYRSREYIKDAGTPERLLKVRQHYETGRIQAGSLETPVPAIFFDRDGTLNHEAGFLRSPDQMQLLPGAAEAVRLVNQSGRLAVVITNQPVIARGECTEAQLREIHNRLEALLGQEHAYLDALYYCPHHPDGGFPGERPELKIRCACRKPGIALFEQAIQDLNIERSRSCMIGDNQRDMQAAANLGIPGIQVDFNQASGGLTVLDAVNRILQ